MYRTQANVLEVQHIMGGLARCLCVLDRCVESRGAYGIELLRRNGCIVSTGTATPRDGQYGRYT
jgi:hypothetical protein